MTTRDVVFTAVAALLIMWAGVLSGAEVALSRVSRVRVAELAGAGRRGAGTLERVVADAPRYLNVLLLLRIAGELSAAVLVTVVAIGRLGSDLTAVLVAVGVMTVVSYVLVGVAPRTLGRQHPDRVALGTAWLAWSLSRLLGPLPRLLIAIGNAVTPGKGLRDGPFSSEAELRDLVDLAEERQVIEAGERRMIHSVFELGDTIVREVMVPRTDIVFIERGKTIRQALSLALRSGFSRIPVVGENEDDVVGIVYLKDLTRRSYDHPEGAGTETVGTVMRSPLFVPDSKPIDELLREMQASRTHVVIVIDEYGGTAGLVTIEDILEEIVGEITDEYDVESLRYEQLDDETARVSIRLPVEELDEIYGTALASEDVGTVGGLLARELGRVPIPGASVTVGGLVLTAESPLGRRNRVGSVLVRRTVPAGAATPQPAQERIGA